MSRLIIYSHRLLKLENNTGWSSSDPVEGSGDGVNRFGFEKWFLTLTEGLAAALLCYDQPPTQLLNSTFEKFGTSADMQENTGSNHRNH